MEHEVTYTFSRALNMMRYGGKKMRCTRWGFDSYASIYMNRICVKSGEFVRTNATLESDEIMGSWVEIRE